MNPVWKQLFRRLTYQIFSPGALLREKYNAFKALLQFDESSLELMAEIEILSQCDEVADHSRVVWLCRRLGVSVAALIDKLSAISGVKYLDLPEYFKKIDFYIQLALALPEQKLSPPFVLDLSEALGNREECGGKAANLAELAANLGGLMLPGCVVTTSAFNYFIECNSLRQKLNRHLRLITLSKPGNLDKLSQTMRELVLDAQLPEDVSAMLKQAVESLGPGPYAVRSSALNEDTEASFAGQYLTRLNVELEDLESAYKDVLASKYSPQALTYRMLCGLSDEETPMAVLIMPMVKAVRSGMILSHDFSPAGESCLRISEISGLGEALVSGEEGGKSILLDRADPGRCLANEGVSPELAASAAELAGLALACENIFGAPQELEWASDEQGFTHILQARPYVPRLEALENPPLLPEDRSPLLTGLLAISQGRASGVTQVLTSPSDVVEEGAILVVKQLYPWLTRYLGRASGVVTVGGGVAGHFASVAREFGLPVMAGPPEALEMLKPGIGVCLDAWSGTVFEFTGTCPGPQGMATRLADTPLGKRLAALAPHISRLNLSDPESSDFKPASCRSLHDIIRFCHEKGMQEMFNLLSTSGRGMSKAKRLRCDLDLNMYILDLGGGFFPQADERDYVTPDDFRSQPLWSFWWGLADPEQERPNTVLTDLSQTEILSEGILIGSSKLFASFGVVAADYAHLMLRFGYHFCVVDSVCGSSSQSNYVNFRFKGGGGTFEQRLLRLEFIRRVLERFGFEVTVRSDLMNARLSGGKSEEVQRKLAILGKLLIQTPLMDIKLKNQRDVDDLTARFLGAAYH